MIRENQVQELRILGNMEDLKEAMISELDNYSDCYPSVSAIFFADKAIELFKLFIKDSFDADYLKFECGDFSEYDMEYSVSIYRNEDGKKYVSIEEIYSYDTDRYLMSDGVSFVHVPTVSSKYIDDTRESNDIIPFCFGDEIGEIAEECDCGCGCGGNCDECVFAPYESELIPDELLSDVNIGHKLNQIINLLDRIERKL